MSRCSAPRTSGPPPARPCCPVPRGSSAAEPCPSGTVQRRRNGSGPRRRPGSASRAGCSRSGCSTRPAGRTRPPPRPPARSAGACRWRPSAGRLSGPDGAGQPDTKGWYRRRNWSRSRKSPHREPAPVPGPPPPRSCRCSFPCSAGLRPADCPRGRESQSHTRRIPPASALRS